MSRGTRKEEKMTTDEMKQQEFENYCRLQRIKHDNGGQENFTLDYEIKRSTALLESMGVSLENLKI